MGRGILDKATYNGIFVMIGLIVLGLFLRSAAISIKSHERVVTVKGLAEREVEANRVIWPVVYKEIGNDLLVLYKSINEKNQIILNYLKKAGLEESEISISAPMIIDMNAERYQSRPSPYRYNVTSVMTVTSEKIELVMKIISSQSELLQKGIALLAEDYQYQTQFIYTLLNDIKPSMIEEATKNAREAAEKFAKDSKSKLGKIKSANQGQFTISNRDANTPQIKSIRVVSTIQYMLRD